MFYVIQIRGRRLMAVPVGDWRLLDAALRCYPGHTGKKRVLRLGLRLLSRVGGLGRLFPVSGELSIGMDGPGFAGWLEEVSQQLGMGELIPVVVWPGDPARGRVYLHFLDGCGRVKAFCKLGLDRSNSARIANEQRMLEELRAEGVEGFLVPEVLAAGEWDGRGYLVVSRTPDTARASDWERDGALDAVISQLAGAIRRLRADEVRALAWWRECRMAMAEVPGFLVALESALRGGVEVCRVHGDLNQTNVLRDEARVWLIDWEHASEVGPCLTDSVCVALDREWARERGDAKRVWDCLCREFGAAEEGDGRNRLLLALGFLGAAAFTPALELAAGVFAGIGHQGGTALG